MFLYGKESLVKVNVEYLSSSRFVKLIADDKNRGIKVRILCNSDTGKPITDSSRDSLKSSDSVAHFTLWILSPGTFPEYSKNLYPFQIYRNRFLKE